MEKFGLWALVAVLLLVLVSSCATSRGSLFEIAMQTDEEPSSSGEEEGEGESSEIPYEEVDPPGIYISSTPEGATVYINGREMGTTPYAFLDAPSGTYRITFDLFGYYPQSLSVGYQAGTASYVDVVLEEITGYIDLQSNIAGAVYTIDGFSYDEGVHELRIGEYYLEVEAFGYKPYGVWLTVEELRTTRVYAELEEAPFELTDAWVERQTFSPRNPYSLGSTVLRFRVSAPGTGVFSVEDAEGTVVRTIPLADFDTWDQNVRWYGRDDDGRMLPDGLYRLRVRGVGSREGNVETLSETATIDAGALISFRSTWSGTSGLLYAGTAEVLPTWALQFDVRTLGHQSSGITFLPSQASFRLGLPGDSEVHFQGTGYFIPEASSGWTAGFGYKRKLVSGGNFALAAETHGTFGPGAAPGNDPLTNFPGLGVGFPLTVDVGNWGLNFGPELKLSWETPVYGGVTPPSGTFFPWLYGRAGIFYDRGTVMAGLSAAARTTSFQEGLQMDFPIAAGAEINWIIPNTQLVLSANAAMEYAPIDPNLPDNSETFYIMAGAAIGILN